MGFNYGLEKLRFDIEWQKLAEEYSAAGFDAAGIKAMRDFDWELFKKRRITENSEQVFPSETLDGDCEKLSTLYRKFASLSYVFDETAFTGRYAWIESIDNQNLVKKLSNLSDDDKELLTLLAFDGYMQTEIANMQGCTKQAVNKRLSRIKKYLRQG